MTHIDASAEELVRFLGLADVLDRTAGRRLMFPLGLLYPYSSYLGRVYERYAGVAAAFPDAVPLLVGELPEDLHVLPDDDELTTALAGYLSSIKDLYGRTAFAPGPTGPGLARAYMEVTDAVRHAKQQALHRVAAEPRAE